MMKKVMILLFGFVLISVLEASALDITGEVSISDHGAANEAVVYLEGGPKPESLKKAVVDQRNKAFSPHVTVITVGTKVEFPNHDTVFHNVFAYFDAKRFDLGMYPKGEKKSIVFDKPGLVALLCNVHSNMSAYIMVVDTSYYAVTDSKGRFTIKNVQPGTYTLHGWHESGAKFIKKIVVKASDNAPLKMEMKRG